MKLKHVRNATLVLEVGELRILVDPMLGAKGSMDPFPNAAGNAVRNPTVDLVVPLAELLDVDVVVVTHTHADHWDEAAASVLPRGIPLLVQNESDRDLIESRGFTRVQVLTDDLQIGGAAFSRTEGQHGSDAVMAEHPRLGEVSGFVVTHPGEPSVYVAGDTVWNDRVRAALDGHRPEVIVLNTGEARFTEDSPILMGADDIMNVRGAAPQAQIVAVHMEALNHCGVTRADVRRIVQEHQLSGQVFVPDDGDELTF